MDFSKYYEEIYGIAKDIYLHPELGYKEHRTSKIVKDYISKYIKNIKIQSFAKTGLKFTLPTEEEKRLKMAFVIELDAVYAPTHFHADKETGAAHNCGHYSQIGIGLGLFRELIERNIYKDFDFSISFVFVPAEEYLDLKYREELRKNNEIIYFGGKPEAMRLGMFDEFDFAMAVHAMGGDFKERTIEINSNLAGFLYKRYNFIGKASHAGFSPFTGVNAYSMSTLFNVGVGLMRQQLDEKQMVRINPIIMESDMGTNVIPNKITIGTDIRTQTIDYMKEVVKRLDDVAKGSAMSLQGEVHIETQMGYLPFVQDRYLSSFVLDTFNQFEKIPSIRNENPISAAGDIGDLSFMMPCIQIGYSGFSGTIHGDDFIENDPEFIFSIFPEFLIEVLKNMNDKIDKEKIYHRNYKEYEKLISEILK